MRKNARRAIASLGVVLGLFYAHRQLDEARRSAEVSTLMSIRAEITESRRRVYGGGWGEGYSDLLGLRALPEYDESSEEDFAAATRLLFENRVLFDLRDHLRTLEFSCGLYIAGELPARAARFVEEILRTDIDYLGTWGTPYYENGSIVVSVEHELQISWVKPSDEEHEGNAAYPNTLRCMRQFGIRPVG